MELNHKSIVVIYLMHFGDVLLTTPFLEALRHQAPDATITYVMDEKLGELMAENPHIDNLVLIDKKGKDRSRAALSERAREIRETYKPDIVINLHPMERPSYLAWKIKAPVTTGVYHPLFWWNYSPKLKLNRNTLHAADMYCDVLSQLGCENLQYGGLSMYTNDEWDEEARRFYDDEGIGPQATVIGLNVGSAIEEKRWDPKKFAVVGDYFHKKGCEIVFFGGPMDVDMVKAVRKEMKEVSHVATGLFGLGALASAMKRCQVFVSGDSGPMHMAAALQVPVVALFGPSNPLYYGPYKVKQVVVSAQEYTMDGKSVQDHIRKGDYAPLSAIEGQAVIDAVDQLLT